MFYITLKVWKRPGGRLKLPCKITTGPCLQREDVAIKDFALQRMEREFKRVKG
jgi:hypothetical protein